MIYIFYHANCTDGLGAKYAAWKKFGNAATYVAMDYNVPIQELLPNSEVYMVDYSRSRTEIMDLREQGHRVVVIDHHKTAEEDLHNLEDTVFDMNKSGAVLAWEYFHPETEVPRLLEYIQDRDLWNWKLQGTRELLKALEMADKDWDITKWDGIIEEMQKDEKGFFGKGVAVTLWEDIRVERSTAKDRIRFFEFPYFGESGLDEIKRYRVGMINSTILPSEMGNQICRNFDVDIGIVYFIDKRGTVNLSFRSQKGSGVDVSKVAKLFGGGGHSSASGAKMSYPAFFNHFLDKPELECNERVFNELSE